MKNRINLLGIIAILAIIGLGFTACGGDDDNGGGTGGGKIEGENCHGTDCREIGSTGPGEGIIIYHDCTGFTVIGLGTCYYLEAAPTNQSTGVPWSSTDVDVKGTGTEIGRGKANTAAIIAAHSGDTTSDNAAKAAVVYSGGDKNDWFLPSKDELNEMYEAGRYLGISEGLLFWSSSQLIGGKAAWGQYFGWGLGKQDNTGKGNYSNVRAIRAF